VPCCFELSGDWCLHLSFFFLSGFVRLLVAGGLFCFSLLLGVFAVLWCSGSVMVLLDFQLGGSRSAIVCDVSDS